MQMLPHLSLNNFIMLFKNKGAKIAQSLVWLYEDVSNHHSKMENIERIEAKKHIIANLDR